MPSHGERRVKARHEITQFYERRRLPHGDMMISDDPDPNDNSSSDEDVEDETYVPSPRAHPHGKGLASASDSGATRDEEIEEEDDGDEGEEDEKIFDVEEINPPSYVDIWHRDFRAPTNPTWRARVSYKGKTGSVRENRRILTRTQLRDAYDYRFHSLFQQDFYESVITTKGKPVENSQWIDKAYMKNKYDPIFDRVIASYKAKHLRDILAFKKDWNNEVIAQFYATICFEEHGDTRKLHWMTKSLWYEVSNAYFTFGWKDASRPRIHLALKLEARKNKFMYPSSKQENFGEITYMLPFYAYLNWLFKRTVTPREGDETKILAYNKNILAVMTPNDNGFEFSVFDFIWEEIKTISENPLKSCEYASYIMHMIERVIARTFFCEKEHHPLRIKNDLRAPVENRRAATPRSSPPRAARGRGQ
jgi:hypothetical protein